MLGFFLPDPRKDLIRRAVRDYLVSLGVPSSQLKITSFGESKPFAMGSNEDAWAQNRRVEFKYSN